MNSQSKSDVTFFVFLVILVVTAHCGIKVWLDYLSDTRSQKGVLPPCQYVNNRHVRDLCRDVRKSEENISLPQVLQSPLSLLFMTISPKDLRYKEGATRREKRIRFTVKVIEEEMQNNKVYPCDRIFFSRVVSMYGLEVGNSLIPNYERICVYDPSPSLYYYNLNLVYSF